MKNLFEKTIENAYDLFFTRKIDEPKFHKLKYGDGGMFGIVLFPNGSVGYIPKSAYFGMQAIPYVREDGVKATKYRENFDRDQVIKFTSNSPSTTLQSFNNKYYEEKFGSLGNTKFHGD